jgi:hypothetical protein
MPKPLPLQLLTAEENRKIATEAYIQRWEKQINESAAVGCFCVRDQAEGELPSDVATEVVNRFTAKGYTVVRGGRVGEFRMSISW